jgi:hypothetical protein
MLMQDKHSDQLADLVISWIDKHVQTKASAYPLSRRVLLAVVIATSRALHG